MTIGKGYQIFYPESSLAPESLWKLRDLFYNHWSLPTCSRLDVMQYDALHRKTMCCRFVSSFLTTLSLGKFPIPVVCPGRL